MNKYVVLSLGLIMSFSSYAQEAIWGNDGPVISPQVNPDNSVTFRYASPKAKEVKLVGNFIPKVKVETQEGIKEVPGNKEFTRGKDGVWTLTTPPLSPDLYLYNFMVDSVVILDPLNIHVNRDVTFFTNRLLIPGEESEPYNENDIPHGTVSKMWYHSPMLESDRRLSVYTPAGYETSGISYPVLYLLHGMGGDENAWLDNGRLAQIMDWLIDKGLAEPMIVVTPNGNPRMQISPADNNLLSNSPQMDEFKVVDGSYETSFPEIVEFIDSNFRTLPDKKHRAIAGLSMGGFHSMTISKEFPELFDYVGLFSAATYRALNREGFDINQNPEVYRDYEGKVKKQFASNPALYWIGIGKDDFLYDNNAEFRKMLDEGGYNYEYVESEGGHTWTNWRKYLKTFASRLFK